MRPNNPLERLAAGLKTAVKAHGWMDALGNVQHKLGGGVIVPVQRGSIRVFVYNRAK
jgi:hypothetical protein